MQKLENNFGGIILIFILDDIMNKLKQLIEAAKNAWLGEKSCITCSGFVWWDGDYCCLADMSALQESPDGKFTKDIIPFIKASKYCKKYKKGALPLYEDEYKKFMNNE